MSENGEIYLVKDSNGASYVQQVGTNGSTVVSWTGCQRCALRMNRPVAHRVAHINGRSYRVFRLRLLTK